MRVRVLGIGRGNPGVCWGFAGVWLHLHNVVVNYLEIFIIAGQYMYGYIYLEFLSHKRKIAFNRKVKVEKKADFSDFLDF